jgi:hypothetical protein
VHPFCTSGCTFPSSGFWSTSCSLVLSALNIQSFSSIFLSQQISTSQNQVTINDPANRALMSWTDGSDFRNTRNM